MHRNDWSKNIQFGFTAWINFFLFSSNNREKARRIAERRPTPYHPPKNFRPSCHPMTTRRPTFSHIPLKRRSMNRNPKWRILGITTLPPRTKSERERFYNRSKKAAKKRSQRKRPSKYRSVLFVIKLNKSVVHDILPKVMLPK